MAKHSYAPKAKVVSIPRPGGLTIGDTSRSTAPTKPAATPALHKQYNAGTRIVRSPKTEGRTSQGRQVN